MEKEEDKAADEWELLPPNTSFLGLEDIKDLFSKEIDYIDYFIEQPLIQLDQLEPQQKTQVYDEEFVQEIKVEDPKQTICKTTELKDTTSIDHNKEDLADDKPCSKRRRPLGLGELLSIGAAVAAAMVCGFLLGSGRRQEQKSPAETRSFQIYADDKAMKQMVRQANRINQVLVPTSASGMQPAAISFGRCFNDVL